MTILELLQWRYIGDFNVKPEKDKNEEEVGNYEFGERNERSQRLEFAHYLNKKRTWEGLNHLRRAR